MRKIGAVVLALMLGNVAHATSIEQMRNHRRVLIVAAPAETDVQLRLQRKILAGWYAGAADRDVTIVEIVGAAVHGADDRAAELRGRYRLSAGSFAAVLVGKDGHVAKRSATPISGSDLQKTIDAMPMRRAGKR